MNNAEFVIILISIITGTAYSILIILFTLGWLKLKKTTVNKLQSTFISIVVPIRNEEGNIKELIKNLQSLHYPEDLREFIFINDHSTDNTLEAIKKYERKSGIRVLDLPSGSNGKKAAIDHGIKQAHGSLITTLDADCTLEKNWLKAISRAYEADRYKMIAGPVAIHRPRGWLASFQALELLSLVASGAGAIGIGKPIMCNGANLSYEKDAYREVEGFRGNDHLAGGDDIFMMEKINKMYPSGSIGFISDPDAIVYTTAARNIKEFLNQRFRWVAKSPAYSNPFLIVSAVVVLLFNLCLLISLSYAAFSETVAITFGSIFLLKVIIDFPILWSVSGFAGQRHLIVWYIPFQLLYIIFISLTGILGNLLSFTWKDRK
ncbi:MAG: glycosyltransferase [Bacteroidales bacterium]|nr:glycosyltransferase [Bacteroidales bacterium]